MSALSLQRWSAFSPLIDDRAVWEQWARTGEFVRPDDASRANPTDIPAILRRRLSPMGRAAIWTAGQVFEESAPPIATVYCSRHGEVERTVGLLREIAAAKPLSPTVFSLSVHNAAVGIFSIARSITHNIVAISAGSDGICAALMEASALLSAEPEGATVLCIICDDPLPEPYAEAPEYDRFPAHTRLQALSLLVSHGDIEGQPALEFDLGANTDKLETPAVNQNMLKFLLNPEITRLSIGAGQRLWNWKKR